MELQAHLYLDLQLEIMIVNYVFDLLLSCFSQGFFISSDNFFTSAKFIGSGMKWEAYEPDSPKGG